MYVKDIHLVNDKHVNLYSYKSIEVAYKTYRLLFRLNLLFIVVEVRYRQPFHTEYWYSATTEYQYSSWNHILMVRLEPDRNIGHVIVVFLSKIFSD